VQGHVGGPGSLSFGITKPSGSVGSSSRPPKSVSALKRVRAHNAAENHAIAHCARAHDASYMGASRWRAFRVRFLSIN
jgi:hypothetical protein